MRCAFITGIEGQDGSYLAELLLAKGYEVHGIYRRTSGGSAGNLKHLEAGAQGKKLFLYPGELDEAESVREPLSRCAPDELYHLASQSHVGQSFEQVEETCRVTGLGALKLLEMARNLPKPPRFFHASSSEIFGSPEQSPQDEKTAINPVTPYGCAKAFGTQMTGIYRKNFGLFAVNGILFNHESPRRGENFVTRKICRAAAAIKAGRQKELTLGDTSAERDWGNARDYVRGMWLALQHTAPEDFVFATGKLHRVQDIVEIAFGAAGLDWRQCVRTDKDLFRPADPRQVVGNAAKAKKLLGWEPEITFEATIAEMVRAELAARPNILSADDTMREFAPKILEIGSIPFMHESFPRSTDFYSTWAEETISDPANGRNVMTLDNLSSLVMRLKNSRYDLVVVQAGAFAPWGARALSRALLRRKVWRGPMSVLRGFGTQWLRGLVAAPIAVLDLDDPAVIDRSNIFLLDKAVAYFKRELPTDHWQVFNGTLHWRVPTPRFRLEERNRERIAKLRPISLGIPFPVMKRPLPTPLSPAEKTMDVFFAGRVHGSSTVRERGLKELLALRAEGVTIDVPEEPLALDEYLARCARAWIVWSPAGYGWQCFRTSEAALCGSVPLVNRPTIEQYRPLVEGEQALYYDVEPGALSRAVRSALADRDKLIRMAAAAREQVLRWHTPAALARYIAETTMEMARKK